MRAVIRMAIIMIMNALWFNSAVWCVRMEMFSRFAGMIGSEIPLFESEIYWHNFACLSMCVVIGA